MKTYIVLIEKTTPHAEQIANQIKGKRVKMLSDIFDLFQSDDDYNIVTVDLFIEALNHKWLEVDNKIYSHIETI